MSAERLRLDYMHGARNGSGSSESIEEMQLFALEETVNGWISRGSEVYTGEVDLATCQRIPGIGGVYVTLLPFFITGSSAD